MKYAILGLLFVVPFVVNAQEIQCPVGEIVQSVEVSPAIPSIPAVTHIEVVIDTPAYDEVVVDSPAYTNCDYVNHWGHYNNSTCTHSDYDYIGGKLSFYLFLILLSFFIVILISDATGL